MVSKDAQAPVPGICDYVNLHGLNFGCLSANSKIEKLFWIIQAAQCTERVLKSGRGGQSNAMWKGFDTLPYLITGLKMKEGATSQGVQVAFKS